MPSRLFALLLTVSLYFAEQTSNQTKLNAIECRQFYGLRYEGKYETSQSQKLFNHLDSKTGNMRIIFSTKDSFETQLMLTIVLYDPIYHDLNAIVATVSLNSSALAEDQVSINGTAEVYPFYHQRMLDRQASCGSLITLQVNKAVQGNCQTWSFKLTTAVGDSSRDECKFDFSSSDLLYTNKEIKKVGYCIFISILLIIELYFNLKFVARVQHMNPVDTHKYSILTMAFCTQQDLFYVLVFVTRLWQDYTSTYMVYIAPIVLFSVQMMFVDYKLLFFFIRMRQAVQHQQPRRILASSIGFYLLMLTYMTVMFIFPFQTWLILLQLCILTFQVIHNAKTTGRSAWDPIYIISFLTVRRMLIPLYEHGCPQNAYMLHPDFIFVVLWMALYGLHILFLYLQHSLGSRFFLPKRCQPGYYDYVFTEKKLSNEVSDCPICYQPLSSDRQEGYNSQQIQISNEQTINTSFVAPLLLQYKVARTPCNHIYHISCCKRWLTINNFCPLCNAEIPQFPE